jgi:hypothetical protein
MNPIAVLAIVGLGLAALALFQGITSMAHGGPEDDSASYHHMLARVGWQALAVLFVFLGLLGYLS